MKFSICLKMTVGLLVVSEFGLLLCISVADGTLLAQTRGSQRQAEPA
jgi:hypothetical protein